MRDKKSKQAFDRVELVGGPHDGLVFDGEEAGKFKFEEGISYELQGTSGFYAPRDVRGYTMFMSYNYDDRSKG